MDNKMKYNEFNKLAALSLRGIKYEISLLSNASALLFEYLDDVNWVGFYLFKDSKLILGPFQGKPACLEIKVGSGVCGRALKKNKTIIVDDVDSFIGYIACDSESKSEIVIPINVGKQIYGVLDIDSQFYSRFNQEDKEGLEDFVLLIEKELNNILNSY